MSLTFTTPIDFEDALDSRRVRALLPTSLNSAQLSALRRDLKERAFFSARVTNAEFLQKLDTMIAAILQPRQDATGATVGENNASARVQLKEFLDEIGYTPEPDKEGGIEDLSSDARLDLILDTNVEMAQGYGHFKQGQDEDVLLAFPAQELIRVSDAKEPRDWPERWVRAGGHLYNGRMIARKDDEVWNKLGDPGIFNDGLGNPYPPFAFNSGMDVVDIARSEAIALGVMADDEFVVPQDRGFNRDLKATPQVRSQSLRSGLEGEGYRFNRDGALTLGGAE